MSERATLVCDFFVPGAPATAGSKKGFFNKRSNRVMLVDDNPRGKLWMAQVAAFAQPVAPGVLFDEPLAIEVELRLARPKGHSGKRGLLPSAPAYPATIPDCTKLMRCLEDGLTGVLWRDDARIVSQLVRKVYTEDGRTGARVRVWTMPAAVREAPERAETVLIQGGLFG